MGARRQDQIRAIAAELDGLLSELQATVDALNSVLASPPADGQAPGAMEVSTP